jgi:hypothetical protein
MSLNDGILQFEIDLPAIDDVVHPKPKRARRAAPPGPRKSEPHGRGRGRGRVSSKGRGRGNDSTSGVRGPRRLWGRSKAKAKAKAKAKTKAKAKAKAIADARKSSDEEPLSLPDDRPHKAKSSSSSSSSSSSDSSSPPPPARPPLPPPPLPPTPVSGARQREHAVVSQHGPLIQTGRARHPLTLWWFGCQLIVTERLVQNPTIFVRCPFHGGRSKLQEAKSKASAKPKGRGKKDEEPACSRTRVMKKLPGESFEATVERYRVFLQNWLVSLATLIHRSLHVGYTYVCCV